MAKMTALSQKTVLYLLGPITLQYFTLIHAQIRLFRPKLHHCPHLIIHLDLSSVVSSMERFIAPILLPSTGLLRHLCPPPLPLHHL
jgi:hypothetical protein